MGGGNSDATAELRAKLQEVVSSIDTGEAELDAMHLEYRVLREKAEELKGLKEMRVVAFEAAKADLEKANADLEATEAARAAKLTEIETTRDGIRELGGTRLSLEETLEAALSSPSQRDSTSN